MSGVKHSAFGENGQMQIDANIPANWKQPLQLENHGFVNSSTKTDRYYYLDNSNFLHSTLNGIAYTQLTNFAVRNGALKKLISSDGLFFYESSSYRRWKYF